MTFVDCITYFLTHLALILAPGQMMLLVVARAASGDVRGAIIFSVGCTVGCILILSTVCFGMSLWMSDEPGLLAYSKYAMLLYFAWIAYGMWTKGVIAEDDGEVAKSSAIGAFLAGFIANMTSPYMMILFPLVLPEVLDIQAIEMPGYLIAVLSTMAAEVVGAIILIGGALQLRRLIRTPRAAQIMNRSLASILMIGGSVMAFI